MINYDKYDPSDYEGWVEKRRAQDGIGGSEIGTLFNSKTRIINRFKTRRMLFYEKVGLSSHSFIHNANTYSGHVMEEIIVENYFRYFDPDKPDMDTLVQNAYKARALQVDHFKKTGVEDPDLGSIRIPRAVHAIITNDKYPAVFANIDREFDWKGKDHILEIKNMLSHAMNRYDGLPPAYIFQIQLYMLVCEYSFGEIGSLKDGRFYEEINIEFSEKLGKAIDEKSQEFWELVEQGKEIVKASATEEEALQELAQIEPEIDGSDKDMEFLRSRYRKEDKAEVIGSDKALDQAVAYAEAREKEKSSKEEKEYLGNWLKDYFIKNKAESVIFGDGKKITYIAKKNGTPSLVVPKSLLDYGT